MRDQTVFDQQLRQFLFQLVWSQPNRRNLPWNQRIGDLTYFTNPQVSGKFRDVKDLNVQKIAAANWRIYSASTG